MKRLMTGWLTILLLLVAAATAKCVTPGAGETADRRLFTSGDGDGTVYYVPQFTEFKEVSEADLLFLRKVLKRARQEGVRAVIFELDTPGGRVDVALRYLSVFAKSEVPVVAHLNPQGISAGMIIALAADRIAIDHHGVIGDAMPLAVTPGGTRPITAPPDKTPPATSESDKSEKPADKPEKQPKPASPSTWEPLLEEIRKLRKDDSRQPLTNEERRLADQKFLTVFFKVLQVLAEKNDRPVKVIRATADPYTVLTVKDDGIQHDGRAPLTLSATEAQKLGVVDYVVRGRNDILAEIGLPNARIEEIRPSSTDQIFSFLAHPMVAGILVMLGLVGLFVEVKTPGFGVPGILGICAVVLYFIGQIAVGASEWGPMVIFFIGVVLLALEIFLIPGFGLVGVLGGVCVLGSMVAAFGFDNLETAVQVVGGGLIAALLIITVLVMYVLPKTALFRRFALAEAVGRDGGEEAAQAEALVGQEAGTVGKAISPLRPSGTVELDGKRFDAVTEGDFIDAGCEVQVVGKRNFQLIVRKI